MQTLRTTTWIVALAGITSFGTAGVVVAAEDGESCEQSTDSQECSDDEAANDGEAAEDEESGDETSDDESEQAEAGGGDEPVRGLRGTGEPGEVDGRLGDDSESDDDAEPPPGHGLEPKADLEELEVDGDCSTEGVAEAIDDRIPALKHCYNRELQQNPELEGSLEISWTIASTGEVDRPTVEVDDSTLGDPDVTGCVGRVVKRLEFDLPEDGTCDGEATMEFSAR